MQTEDKQPPNREKSNRKRNQRIVRTIKRVRRKLSPHKRNIKIDETNKHFTTTLKINGVTKEFLIDIGSPISLQPPMKKS